MYAFRAELWQYEGSGAWYFVSLPTEVADDIRAKCASVLPDLHAVLTTLRERGSFVR